MDALTSWNPVSRPPTASRFGPSRRVLILGGGVSGISVAKTFLHSPPKTPPTSLLVMEANSSLGGVWAKGRAYPGLFSNVPRGLYGLAEHPLWDPPTVPISRPVLAEEISG